nr:hypothetical protein Q903MT_gene4609 [Picea sitchensis]
MCSFLLLSASDGEIFLARVTLISRVWTLISRVWLEQAGMVGTAMIVERGHLFSSSGGLLCGHLFSRLLTT